MGLLRYLESELSLSYITNLQPAPGSQNFEHWSHVSEADQPMKSIDGFGLSTYQILDNNIKQNIYSRRYSWAWSGRAGPGPKPGSFANCSWVQSMGQKSSGGPTHFQIAHFSLCKYVLVGPGICTLSIGISDKKKWGPCPGHRPNSPDQERWKIMLYLWTYLYVMTIDKP